jgi:hypothetical protein
MLAWNNVASSRTPSPTGPRGEDVGVKTVHKHELSSSNFHEGFEQNRPASQSEMLVQSQLLCQLKKLNRKTVLAFARFGNKSLDIPTYLISSLTFVLL